MGAKIFLTGLVFFMVAVKVESFYSKDRNEQSPSIVPATGLLGFIVMIVGALIAIWEF